MLEYTVHGDGAAWGDGGRCESDFGERDANVGEVSYLEVVGADFGTGDPSERQKTHESKQEQPDQG